MDVLNTETVKKLYEAVLLLENEEECRAFFEDVCTIKELLDISQRLKVAQMLSENMSYQDIVKSTGASTATISRVNRCLMYGGGGYKSVIGKLNSGEKTDENK